MPLLPGVQFSDCLTTSFLEMTVNFGDIHKRIMVKASKNPISYMWWQSSCGYVGSDYTENSGCVCNYVPTAEKIPMICST